MSRFPAPGQYAPQRNGQHQVQRNFSIDQENMRMQQQQQALQFTSPAVQPHPMFAANNFRQQPQAQLSTQPPFYNPNQMQFGQQPQQPQFFNIYGNGQQQQQLPQQFARPQMHQHPVLVLPTNSEMQYQGNNAGKSLYQVQLLPGPLSGTSVPFQGQQQQQPALTQPPPMRQPSYMVAAPQTAQVTAEGYYSAQGPQRPTYGVPEMPEHQQMNIAFSPMTAQQIPRFPSGSQYLQGSMTQPMYAVQQQQPIQQQQQAVQAVQQQLPQKAVQPLQPRAKKILDIIDPTTHEKVQLPGHEEAAQVTAAALGAVQERANLAAMDSGGVQSSAPSSRASPAVSVTGAVENVGAQLPEGRAQNGPSSEENSATTKKAEFYTDFYKHVLSDQNAKAPVGDDAERADMRSPERSGSQPKTTMVTPSAKRANEITREKCGVSFGDFGTPEEEDAGPPFRVPVGPPSPPQFRPPVEPAAGASQERAFKPSPSPSVQSVLPASTGQQEQSVPVKRLMANGSVPLGAGGRAGVAEAPRHELSLSAPPSDELAASSLAFENTDDAGADGEPSCEEGEIVDEDVDEEAASSSGAISEYDTLVNQLQEFWDKENVFNPLTQRGERKYSRSFMEVAMSLPMSKRQPECVENIKLTMPELFAERKSQPVAGRRTTNFEPTRQSSYFDVGFPLPGLSGGGRSLVGGYPKGGGGRGGMYTSRGSGSGYGRGGGPKKAPMVIPRPSLTQDIKLRQVENPWKPGVLDEKKGAEQTQESDDEEVKIRAVCKRARGILNRITPNTFDDLLKDFLELELNSDQRLTAVIDIFFDKAVEEPKYCALYGQLCSAVSQDQVAKSEKSQFRRLLLNKCQREFEREKSFEEIQRKKEEEIEHAETDAKRKELQDALDELAGKEKRRLLGTIKFIGELYTLSMLTGNIMVSCLTQLFSRSADEEALECVCKLLTTVGKKLQVDPSANVKEMQGRAYITLDQLPQKDMSSRIRFMIKDLLELRKNNWEHRRKDDTGPMRIGDLRDTIEQEKLKKQTETKQMEAEMMSKKGQQQDRYTGGGRQSGGGKQRGGAEKADDRRGGAKQQEFAGGGRFTKRPTDGAVAETGGEKIQAPLLSQHLAQAEDSVRLGPQKSSWSKGAGAKTRQQQAAPDQQVQAVRTTNRFTNLDASRGSNPPSRDSSQTRRVDELQPDERASPRPSSAVPAASSSCQSEESSRVASPVGVELARPELAATEQRVDLRQYAEQLLDEYLTSGDSEEAERLINAHRGSFVEIVRHCLNHAVEGDTKRRAGLATLLAKFVRKNAFPLASVAASIADFVESAVADDLLMDCPRLWDYLGEVLAGLYGDTNIELASLGVVLDKAEVYAKNILVATLKHLKANTSSNLLARWQSSGLASASYVQCEDTLALLRSQGLSDLLETAQSSATYATRVTAGPARHDIVSEICENPLAFAFERGLFEREPDAIIEYLDKKFSNEQRMTPEFARLVVNEICPVVISSGDDADAVFNEAAFKEKYTKILVFVLQSKPALDLAALSAFAEYIRYRLDFPKGILLQVFQAVDNAGVIPIESFLEWYKENHPRADLGTVFRASEISQFFAELEMRATEAAVPDDGAASPPPPPQVVRTLEMKKVVDEEASEPHSPEPPPAPRLDGVA